MSFSILEIEETHVFNNLQFFTLLVEGDRGGGQILMAYLTTYAHPLYYISDPLARGFTAACWTCGRSARPPSSCQVRILVQVIVEAYRRCNIIQILPPPLKNLGLKEMNLNELKSTFQ